MGNFLSSFSSSAFIPSSYISEKYLHAIFPMNEDELEKKQSFSINLDDLKFILMSNPQLLQEKDLFIENLIDPLTDHTKKLVNSSRMFKDLDICNILTNLRLIRPHNSDSICFAEQDTDNSEFLEYICTNFFQYVSNIPYDNDIVQQGVRLFKNTPLNPGFFPISPDNLLDDHQFSGLLLSRAICRYGIATNGLFLFVLSPQMVLHTFPILYNASLLPPFTHILKLEDDPDAYISITNDNLIAHSNGSNYFFPLSVLSRPGYEDSVISPTNVKNAHSYKITITDGASIIQIDSAFNIFISYVSSDKFFHCSRLMPSQMRPCESFPSVLTTELFNSPAVTNGAFIMFYLRIDDQHYCCREFSTLTGEHVGDFIIEYSGVIISAGIDIINKVHWIADNASGSIMIHSYRYVGFEDPFLYKFSLPQTTDVPQHKLINTLCYMMSVHLFSSIGNKPTPIFKVKAIKTIKSLLGFMMNLMESSADKLNDPIIRPFFLSILQIYILIVASNVNDAIMNNPKSGAPIKKSIIFLLLRIPSTFKDKLSICITTLMLFNMFDQLFDEQLIPILIGILESSHQSMYIYILKEIEKSKILSSILTTNNQSITNLMQFRTDKHDTVSPNVTGFLFVQQNVIVREALLFLKNDKFSSIKIFNMSESNNSPLDILSDYSQCLVDQVLKAFSSANSTNELFKSTTFVLFDNFINLLWGLSGHHAIAQIILPLINVLPKNFNTFLKRMNQPIHSDPEILDMNCSIAFSFGIFAATLIKGGDYSLFEDHYKWLIRSNMSLCGNNEEMNKLLDTNNDFGDQIINDLVNNGTEQLSKVYKKWKPAINSRVREPYLSLDRLALAPILVHLNLLDVFNDFVSTGNLPQELRTAFDQMVRVRNAARSLIQENKSIDHIIQKCRILIRMKTSFLAKDNAPKLLSDFIVSNESADSLIHYISNQEIRLVLTGIGFSLLENLMGQNLGQEFDEVVADTLSRIDNFDGLSSILRCSNKPIKSITTFIDRVIESNSKHLLLIVHKLFKSGAVSNESMGIYIQKVHDRFKANPSNNSLFGLLYGRIGLIPNVLQNYQDLNSLKEYDLFFLSDALSIIQCEPELYQKLLQYATSPCSESVARFVSHALFNAMCSKKIPQKILKRDFLMIIDTIGHFALENKFIYIACELVTLLRNVLLASNTSTSILFDVFDEIKPEKAKEMTLCGLFAVLGGNLTYLRPYCCVSYSGSRGRIINAVSVGRTDHPTLYELPLTFESKAITRNKSVLIPEDTIKFTPLFFFNIDYIMTFFDVCTSDMSSKVANMYLSSLFIYSYYEDLPISNEYAGKIVNKLSNMMNPCDSINMYSSYLRQEVNKPNIDKVNDFYTLINNSSLITYLSPVIDKNSIYEVFATFTTNFTGYFGIVTDSMSSTVKYALFSHNGLIYDACVVEYDVLSPFETTLEFTVNPVTKRVVFGNQAIEFPSSSEDFRIVIATHSPNTAVSIKIPNRMNPFDKKASPQLEKVGFVNPPTKNITLYSFPEWSNVSLAKAQKMLQLFQKLPKFIPIISDTGDEHNMYPKPPEDMSLHFIDTQAASKEYIQWAIKTLTYYNNSQWATVIMMNIVLSGFQSLISSSELMRLFSLLLIPLENFSEESFKAGEFPFSLDSSVIHQSAKLNKMNFDIQERAQRALLLISHDHNFRESFVLYIVSMMNSSRVHLLLNNKFPIAYYPRGTTPTNFEVDANENLCDSMIIAPPTFNTVNQIFFINNMAKEVELPIIHPKNSIKLDLNGSRLLRYPMTALLISRLNNSWIYGTSIELLIMLKEYYLMFKEIDTETQSFVQSILIDLIIIQSPFIMTYVKQFLVYYGQDFIPPSNITTLYISRLLLLATYLNNDIDRDNSQLMSFFVKEKRLLTSDLPLLLAPYFPEFFSVPPLNPRHQSINLNIPSLDIDLHMADPLGIFMLIRSVITPRDSLQGFPFWEVLPIWMSFTLTEKNFGKPSQMPIIKKVSNYLISINNPDQVLCDVFIEPIHPPPDSAITLVSSKETFEDAQYLNGGEMKRPIRLHGTKMFISFVEYSTDFVEIRIEKVNTIDPENSNATSVELIPSNIHDEFVYEMYVFIKEWTVEDTSNLLLSFPSYMLEQNKFSLIKEGAKASQILNKFPPRVILLYTYLIHRLNYLWKHKKVAIPKSFWNQVISYITLDFAAEQFVNAIPCSNIITPSLTIDRHEAHRIIIDGRGSYTKSVIYQFSNIAKTMNYHRLRSTEPWSVDFKGESAIDAGGPRHELFREISDSIFQPTSRLFVLSPNGRYKCGSFRDVFIPSTTLGRAVWHQYKSIGIFIGIIARTGYPQSMPFAPLVWKYIAGEPITRNDILNLDERLKNHITRLKADYFPTRWSLEAWDGAIIELRGTRQNVKRNEVDTYIQECCRARIKTIEPMLSLIKLGFIENVGEEAANQITAGLLNLVVQGSNVITPSQLSSITIYVGFGMNDKMINYYNQAIERMTNEQRSMLLQFITTFKRLPNPSLNSSFKIKVTKSGVNDDMKLPTASTCFNNLYLPTYSTAEITYRKLLAAIEFCQTMENA